MANNQADHWIFSDLKNKVNQYLDEVASREDRNSYVYKRIEPRTRKKDFADALSFGVFDPLWMLTRQWQFGGFQGNDCGTAITTKVKVSRRRLDSIYLKRDMKARKEFAKDKETPAPLEYDVEKRNRPITPFVRIESALHFKKMLEIKELGVLDSIVKEMIRLFRLEPFVPFTDESKKDIETLKTERNSNLKRLYATYSTRIFDGYKLFEVFSAQEIPKVLLQIKDIDKVVEDYRKWFVKKYIPIEKAEDNCWNEEKMGYEIGIGENENIYEAEDYHTGRLSWYSFDAVGDYKDTGKEEPKMLSYLPVHADFPGAPSRLLWEFEDVQVQFGHQANDDVQLLSNAVVMQYVSMYSNDWMLTPIEAEAGTVLYVDGIIVTDTFGERIFIDKSAEQTDEETYILHPDVGFTDRFCLFGTVKTDAYGDAKGIKDFMPREGLLFPPTLRRTEESAPLEEVQFLRDEMANMLWGVETIIGDGCDGAINGKDLSEAVLSVVDAQRKKDISDATLNADDQNNGEKEAEDYEYSFLVQNRVPIHWIPFIPQKIAGESRDIRFRRGRMPVFFNDNYQPVRPSTELLMIRKDEDGKVLPRFINEEEVTGYGVRLVLTAQRTRWFFGKSFNWTGAEKIISQYQANSGLMFDDLINIEGKAIRLHEKGREDTENTQ